LNWSFAQEGLRIFLRGLVFFVLALVSTAHSQAPRSTENVNINLIDTYRYFDHPIDENIYLIRPGDQLVVTFIKADLAPLRLTVNPEGKVIDGTLGIFDLSYKTLHEAKQILTKTLRELYNVDEVAISVTGPLKVGILVSGAVHSPGVYAAYTSQRVSEVIDSAGGILSIGSRRRIVFSGGQQEIAVDLDKADYLGDNVANPCLYAGFKVYVPVKSGALVQVVGEVNQPREIELLSGDDLKLLLVLAGGTRSTADVDAVQILGKADHSNNSEARVEAGDIIWLPAKSGQSASRSLTVFGAITKPGKYDYREGITLQQLIHEAGGFTANAGSGRTTIFRRAEVDEWGRVSDERYPVANVATGSNEVSPIPLQPDDSVFVPVKVGYVKVSGEVRYPGLFPFHEGESALSYITAAGGFLPTADKALIHLHNRVSKATSSHSPDVQVRDGDEVIVNLREELK
jgi:protein involved in polysaccharide export with SLBB domain